MVVAGARSVWAKRRKIELAELVDAAWTLPPLDSLYGSVIAEAFRANGLDIPSATVFTSVTPARNALLVTGRFVSIVQGSVMRFNFNNPAIKVLPIDLPTTRRPIGAISLRSVRSALSRGCSSTTRMRWPRLFPGNISARDKCPLRVLAV